MKINIKTTEEKFIRQLIELLKGVPPVSKLRPKEIDVLCELIYQFNKYKSYPEEHKLAIIFNSNTRKEMRERINLNQDSFNNNISNLRKHKILDNYNRLHPFFNNLVFNNGFELKFIFTE